MCHGSKHKDKMIYFISRFFSYRSIIVADTPLKMCCCCCVQTIFKNLMMSFYFFRSNFLYKNCWVLSICEENPLTAIIFHYSQINTNKDILTVIMYISKCNLFSTFLCFCVDLLPWGDFPP